MKTSFKVTGKFGNSNGAIAHIERTHSLKKSLNNSEILDLKISPHILIFQKNVRPKSLEMSDKKTKTQISKQIQTYKSRLKKYLAELEKLKLENEELKKIELKEKTILRTKAKIEELEKQSKNTLKKRPKFAFDFVDIPFSITQCPPDKLSKKDYEKLNQIALNTLTTLFDIDTKEVGQVAHLDQSSAHIHLTFHIPPGQTLTDITKTKTTEDGKEIKLTYAEMQKEFNHQVIEAFPHLPIEKISPNSENNYLPLNNYKIESKNKLINSLQAQNKSLEVKVGEFEEKSVSRPNMEEYEHIKLQNEKQKRSLDLKIKNENILKEQLKLPKDTKQGELFDYVLKQLTELGEKIENLISENLVLKQRNKALELESSEVKTNTEELTEYELAIDDHLRKEKQKLKTNSELKS